MRGSRPGRIRIRAVLWISLLGFLVLGARVWRLQAVADGRLRAQIDRQIERRVFLTPVRGSIRDAKDRVLAISVQAPSVFADPSVIEDSKAFAAAVAGVLQMNEREVTRRLDGASGRRFVWLKRKVDPSVKERLDRLGTPGIYTTNEGMRVYPERETAAQVLGAVGTDEIGLEGIERQYDAYLRSDKVTVRSEKDARGRAIHSGDGILLEPEAGADLFLTLDAVVQNIAELDLAAWARKSGSRRAMAVLMDPRTGAVLAMASFPRVNPNRLEKWDAEMWRNRPVTDTFEPGSTFKIFSLAAALEAGKLTPDDSLLCSRGSLHLNGKTIRTQKDGHILTPREILAHSNNIGAARIALDTGAMALSDYLRRLGFAEKTGVDLPGEGRGSINPPQRWREIDLANVSFGQGLSVTALQMVAAVSVVANGGLRVRPHIVRKIGAPDGSEIAYDADRRGERVMSQRTARLLTEWMEASTKDDSTGWRARIRGYRTAGKTGTAQKFDFEAHSYSRNRVTSSFLGFAPVSRPRVAAVFVFDEPEKGEHGGELAAPVFRSTVGEVLSYLEEMPDSVPPPRADALTAKAEPIRNLRGGREDISGGTIVVDGTVPDVLGLTMREVLKLAQELRFNVKVAGTGFAVRQVPEPGGPVPRGSTLSVVFEPVAVGGRSL